MFSYILYGILIYLTFYVADKLFIPLFKKVLLGRILNKWSRGYEIIIYIILIIAVMQLAENFNIP